MTGERGDGKKGQDQEGVGQRRIQESAVASGGGEKEQAGGKGRGRATDAIGTSSIFILCSNVSPFLDNLV